MMYLGMGDDASDLQWQTDPTTGRQSIQKRGLTPGEWVIVAGAAYWLWKDKDKSKLFPAAILWYMLTR